MDLKLAKELWHKHPNLVCFYPFTENLLDHSGRALHAELNGGKNFCGYLGGKKCFDGYSNSYLKIPHNPAIDFANNSKFSVGCMFYLSSKPMDFARCLVSKVNSIGNTGWGLYVDTDNTLTACIVGSAIVEEIRLRATDLLQLGKWHYVFLTYDGSKNAAGATLYLNNHKCELSEQTGYIDFMELEVVDDIIVGESNANGGLGTNTFPGGIRYLSIYNRDLSAGEVLTIMDRHLGVERRQYKKSIALTPNTNDNFPLFIHGNASINKNEILFIEGGFNLYSPLFLQAHDKIEDNITSFVQGHESVNDDIPLYTASFADTNKSLNLTIKVDDADKVNANHDLFIHGANESGLIKSMSLFIYSDSSGNIATKSMNLFVSSPLISDVNKNIPLSIEGSLPKSIGYSPLYISNTTSGINNSTTLFIKGDGVTDGAIPFNNSMNLFLRRNPSEATTLFLRGPGESGTKSTNLFVHGAVGVNNDATLFIDAVGAGSENINLYTHGF